MAEKPKCLGLDEGLWIQASPGVFIVVKRTPEDQITIELVSQAESSDDWHQWDIVTIDTERVRQKTWKHQQQS